MRFWAWTACCIAALPKIVTFQKGRIFMTEQNNTTQNTALPANLAAPPLALPPTVPVPEDKPLDRVKEQTEKKRRRELER